jgi:hypothetical protein
MASDPEGDGASRSVGGLDWIATCTVPDNDHYVCTAVLNEFETRHPPTP